MTYTLGTLGQGGCLINGAGAKRFEAMDNGEFESLDSAKTSAQELAVEFARCNDGESASIAITENGDGLPTLISVVTATVNGDVSWS
jgi:hypothetical protein